MDRLNCGVKTRQCGGRCVPKTMHCGDRRSPHELRNITEAIEDSIKDAPVENVYIIDSKTGGILDRSVGDRTSAVINNVDGIRGNVVTHNHPTLTNDKKSEFYKGQSLSNVDIATASYYGAKEIRAVTNTYRHSMRPGVGGWKDPEVLWKSYDRNYTKTVNEMRWKMVFGGYTHDQVRANLWHEINKKVAKEQGMVYTRTLLNGTRADAKGKKCGKSYISASKKCNPGKGSASLKQSTIEEQPQLQEESPAVEPQVQPGEKVELRPRGAPTFKSVVVPAAVVVGTVGGTAAIAAAWTVHEMGKAAANPQEFTFPRNENDVAQSETHYGDFQEGDLIHRAFKFNGKYYQHYGVYGGKNEKGEHTVYEVGTPTPDGFDPTVKHSVIKDEPGLSFFKKVPDDQMYKKGKPKFTRQEIVKRASTLVGSKFDYKVTSQNCEVWARAIVEGEGYTTQGDRTNQFVKTAADMASNRMAQNAQGGVMRDLTQTLNYLDYQAKQWRDKSYWDTGIFSSTTEAPPTTDAVAVLPSGLVDPAEFARRVESRAKGNMANNVRTKLYGDYFNLLIALTSDIKEDVPQQEGQEKTDSYKRSFQKSLRQDVKCSPGNKACGKRCLPVKYKCGEVKSPDAKQGGRNTAITIAAVAGGGVTATTGIGLAAIIHDLKKNVVYKGEKPRVPPYGKPDAITFANYDKMKPGDLVYRTFDFPAIGTLRHYAVYGGKDEKGMHFFYSQSDKGVLTKESAEATKRATTSEYAPVPDYKNNGVSREEALKRAEKLVSGKVAIDHLGIRNTCEDLARYVTGNDKETSQASRLNRFSQTVIPVVAKAVQVVYDLTGKGERAFRLNMEQTAEFLANAQDGVTPEQAREMFNFRSKGRADSKVDDFFEASGLITPKQCYEKAIEDSKSIPGKAGQLLFQNTIQRYLMVVLGTIAQVNTKTKKADRYDRSYQRLIRKDAIRCSPGNKPCGSRCVPQRFKCRENTLSQPEVKTKEQEMPKLTQAGAAVAVGAIGLPTAAVLSVGATLNDVSKNLSLKVQSAKDFRIPPNGADAETAKNYDNMQPGDLVAKTFKAPGGTFMHYGIYMGYNNGDHEFVSLQGDGSVIRENGSDIKPGVSEYKTVNDPDKPIDREAVLKKANYMVDVPLDYNVIRYNCETMARGIVHGDWGANQTSKANAITKTVLPAIVGLTKKKVSGGINIKQTQEYLAARESGMPKAEALYQFGIKTEGKKDDVASDFFEAAGIMTPDEFVSATIEKLQEIPGKAKELAFQSELKRYLMMIYTTIAMAKENRSDAKDAASKALAQKQLQTLVYRALSRSYKEKIDRFLKLGLNKSIVMGSFLSKGRVVSFNLDLNKDTLSTAIVKDMKRDSVRLDVNRCSTGLSCNTTCIDKRKVCRLKLAQVAPQSEVRQMKNIATFLQEEGEDNYEGRSIRDMRSEASALGVHKYSRMNKEELEANIKAMKSGSAERERLARSINKKYEAERFAGGNALADYARDWNRAKKILKIAGTGGALTIAAAAMYFYGRAKQEVQKDIDNYRDGFAAMADTAEARAKKLDQPEVKEDGVLFVVGGYKNEDSSASSMAQVVREHAESGNDSDSYLGKDNKVIEFESTRSVPKFEGKKYEDAAQTRYTNEYKGYLYKNGIESRLGNRDLLGFAVAKVTGSDKETPRNEDAIELAAQIYAAATTKEKTRNTDFEAMDHTELTQAFKQYVGEVPSGANEADMKEAIVAVRKAKGLDRAELYQYKPINILAHGAGGGTAREALEVLRRMEGGKGREIAERVNLVTLASPSMGLTEQVARNERNLTSPNDPFNTHQSRNRRIMNNIKNREIESFLGDQDTRRFIAESFGQVGVKNQKAAVAKVIEDEIEAIKRNIAKRNARQNTDSAYDRAYRLVLSR